MNIVAKTDLNFHGVILSPVTEVPGTWLTASQIGYALRYADDKAVQRIYLRHADEFTDKMTGMVKLTTPGGTQETRVFSLRGAHLIAMFARTPVAKEFRRWVLDILDREAAQMPENSPLHRYFVKIIIRDNVFGADVELLGKADTFKAIARGVATDLGFEPTGFISRRPATEKMMRKH
ncbi:BRO-N domain-containing protein [Serratia ureilytica]|uniref:BRO-N domain-containing protein n=1 Tax=Serratia ureilytica TaxID=300181 RepID=UPI0019D18463|nr:Bro-N domain-containing protein [Serratia ureilytica]MBN5283393.1 Bro-N domain-containing protein [Serratia ureilytica]MBN5374682.1 Bro-N domain-containing protein [Serratia ureilytica]